MRRPTAVFLSCLLTCSTFVAQTTVPSTSLPASETGFVVRINVNLVQMDAVVTDSKGRPVTDLKTEDFEILQDGVPQKITNFSYVSEGAKSAAPPVAVPPPSKSEPVAPIPPVPLKREQVRRAVALVVDDLGLSPTGVAYVRGALKKFVDNDMQPGDLVAILRTGAGIGALQQFTTDRRLLYAAIESIRFNFRGRAGSFTPISPAPVLDPNATLTLPAMDNGELEQRRSSGHSTASGPGLNSSVSQIADELGSACSQRTGSTFGSLAAIRYVIQGLRDMPGRKALILFSEKMQVFEKPQRALQPFSDWSCDYSRVQEILRKLTDAAERSAVVIYTVDPRGLDPLVMGAADRPMVNVHRMKDRPEQALIGQESNLRDDRYFDQGGLQYLADETGGTFVFHNDIAGAIREAVDDSGSYYLIAYHPPASTFDVKNSRWKFHSVQVRVKRLGLKVRSRTGFYGFPGQENDNLSLSREEQFARVLVSPFTANDMRVRMTTLFSYYDKSILTTLLYVDGKDLTFSTETDGTHKAVLDVVGITFDENGQAVDDTQQTYTFRGNDHGYTQAVENGIVLTLQHEVKRPGPYQMRVALRDATSQKMGSAHQFVEVPDMKRHRLSLSGILLRQEGMLPSTAAVAESSQAAPDPKGNEAIRIFQPGEKIKWSFQILNAKRGSDQQPNVTVQTRFFRDGNEILRSEPLPVRWPDSVTLDRLAASGQVKIGAKFPPGDYALQVVVRDNLAKKKYAMASQWIDFAVESP